MCSMTGKEPQPPNEQSREGVRARIACCRPARVSDHAILLAVAAEGQSGDVVEITTNATGRDLDPELILFSSNHAMVRLCAANVVCGGERRPLLPFFTLPTDVPFCDATVHTFIESLRAGERIAWELLFVQGGVCDISVFCLDPARP